MTTPRRVPRAVWLMTSACCILIAAAIVFYEKPARHAYTTFLPPDTVHLRSPLVDSIGRVVARCFGKQPSEFSDVMWFTSDSSLGEGQGWYYPNARAVVVNTPYANDKGLIKHEWIHPVEGLLHTQWERESEPFTRECK